jgi:hypothetical protein
MDIFTHPIAVTFLVLMLLSLAATGFRTFIAGRKK